MFMYFVVKIKASKGHFRHVCLVVFRKSELSCCHTNKNFLFSYTTCKDQELSAQVVMTKLFLFHSISFFFSDVHKVVCMCRLVGLRVSGCKIKWSILRWYVYYNMLTYTDWKKNVWKSDLFLLHSEEDDREV